MCFGQKHSRRTDEPTDPLIEIPGRILKQRVEREETERNFVHAARCQQLSIAVSSYRSMSAVIDRSFYTSCQCQWLRLSYWAPHSCLKSSSSEWILANKSIRLFKHETGKWEILAEKEKGDRHRHLAHTGLREKDVGKKVEKLIWFPSHLTRKMRSSTWAATVQNQRNPITSHVASYAIV